MSTSTPSSSALVSAENLIIMLDTILANSENKQDHNYWRLQNLRVLALVSNGLVNLVFEDASLLRCYLSPEELIAGKHTIKLTTLDSILET